MSEQNQVATQPKSIANLEKLAKVDPIPPIQIDPHVTI